MANFYQTPEQRASAYRAIGQTPPPTTSIRDVQLEGGNPAAFLDLGQNQSQSISQSAPDYNKFNQALFQLLTRAQSLGTASFAKQGFNAQEEQVRREQTTPSDLIGASPGLQAGVRSAATGALQPTISAAQQGAQTFGEQIRSFGDAINTTRQFISDIENTKNKSRDDARTLIKDAFSIGGAESLKGLDPVEIARLETEAGYPKGYIEGVSTTLKERELELKRQNDATNKALTTYQTSQLFQGIVNAYNKSPLIQASDRTPVLKDAIKNIRANPSNGALQLNLAYSYIQALDTYQSAVREGELSLVNSIDSKVGQIQGWTQQIINGQIVRPDVAKQIASAAEQVLNTISSAAVQKAKSFESQANVAGVGPQWQQYTAGFQPSYKAGNANDWEHVPDKPTNTITRPPIRFGK